MAESTLTSRINLKKNRQATNEPQSSNHSDHSEHSWVDLGLPSGLKWATCNVGALTPDDFGNYYCWGETTTKEIVIDENCKWLKVPYSQLRAQNVIDSRGNLLPQYDAARQNWGGTWRMPTDAEIRELIDKCTWQWIEDGNLVGYNVTGPNGNSIFLPAAGYRRYEISYSIGGTGKYWSSTCNNRSADHANHLYISKVHHQSSCELFQYGLPIRPVTE